jgi:hypothetical protein
LFKRKRFAASQLQVEEIGITKISTPARFCSLKWKNYSRTPDRHLAPFFQRQINTAVKRYRFLGDAALQRSATSKPVREIRPCKLFCSGCKVVNFEIWVRRR